MYKTLLFKVLAIAEHYRFRLLFLANVAFTITLSIPDSGHAVEMTTFIFFQVTAMIALMRSKYISILALISGFNSLIYFLTTAPLFSPHLPFYFFHNIPVILLYIITSTIMFHHIVWGGGVTNETLYGLGALYLQTGLVFSFFYDFIERLQPGSILTPGGHAGFDSLIYFSIVTLTTLGYGDIQAVNPVARLLVCTESIFGVLFIAIIVSRIMSMLQNDK